MHPAPIVGTFHAAGESAGYKYLGVRSVRWLPDASTARSSCRRTRCELVQSLHRRRVRDPVQRRRARRATATRRPTPTDGPTIFFCGRHEERKGLDVLLEALQPLPDDVTPVDRQHGPGHRPPAGRVRRRPRASSGSGGSPTPTRSPACRAPTVFCAPSLHGESFGVVLIEAMAAGTPIVASGLDGYRNVATDGVDALLVEPGDADAAGRRRCASVLDDDDLARMRCATAGQRRAEDFSMTHPGRATTRAHLPAAARRRPADAAGARRAQRRLPAAADVGRVAARSRSIGRRRRMELMTIWIIARGRRRAARHLSASSPTTA